MPGRVGPLRWLALALVLAVVAAAIPPGGAIAQGSGLKKVEVRTTIFEAVPGKVCRKDDLDALIFGRSLDCSVTWEQYEGIGCDHPDREARLNSPVVPFSVCDVSVQAVIRYLDGTP